MTNKVTFYDTTMRDGEQTIGVNFSVEEKIAIAKGLDDYGVSAIEAGFPAASQKDFEAVKSIAEVVNKAKVVGLARLVRNDINAVIEATKGAKQPMIHVFIATSPVHREFKLHLTKEEILDKIKADVTFTKQHIQDIVFSPEDATRTEPDFLVASVQTAIDAGATMINIPDTVGYDTPEEFLKIYVEILLVLTQLVGQHIRITIWEWLRQMPWQALRMVQRKFKAQLTESASVLVTLT